MTYIVLDMEWNQPYSKIKKYANGVELVGEIIQLGAVKLTSNFDIASTFTKNVKPKYYKKLNRHVKEITGLTDEQLKDCGTFDLVYPEFLEFCGEDFAFVTWGYDDIPMLINSIQAYGFADNNFPKVYNLQVMFNQQITRESRQYSLEAASLMLNLPENTHPHDALFDAVATAAIAKAIDFEKAVHDYDAFGSPSGTKVTKIEGFSKISEAFGDARLSSTVCPICKARLKNGGWTGSRFKRSAIAHCPVHGEFNYKITVYRKDDGFAARKKIALTTKNV